VAQNAVALPPDTTSNRVYLSKWRRKRAEGIELGLSEKARGVKGPSVKTLQQENRKLQR
jgi:hypothetical protein